MAETAVGVELKPCAAGRRIRCQVMLVLVMTQMGRLRRFLLVLAISRRRRKRGVQR